MYKWHYREYAAEALCIVTWNVYNFQIARWWSIYRQQQYRLELK